MLESIVRGDGGDPDRVRQVTIGFQAVPALLAGRVAAATGFWNAEGVALRRRRPATQVFKVDEFGAPAYPELVLVTTPERLRDAPGARRGHGRRAAPRLRGDARRAGRRAGRARRRAPGVDRAGAARELAAVTPAFTAARPGRSASWTRATLRRLGDLGAALRHRATSGPTSRGCSRRRSPAQAPAEPAAPRRARVTSSAPSRFIRERGTTWSKPAASARSRISTSTWL